jgi:DNA-binding GntR family transcriptional regulator
MEDGGPRNGGGTAAGGGPRLERLAGSLGEQAYRAVRDSILAGRFGPGERLVETRLGDELGASRAPVREALKRLVDEGLVLERPRYGYFVREFTAKDLVDVYNVLGALETLAVRLIVRGRAPLEPLEGLVEEMIGAARAGDLVGLVDAEVRFHEELCAAAGNQYLDTMFRSVSGLTRMALSLDDAAYADLGEVAAEYVPLLEAIQAGAEEQAVSAILEHTRASVLKGEVMARLGGDPADVLGPIGEPPAR